jgi:muramoyltetrapeptide carboxypeptidase
VSLRTASLVLRPGDIVDVVAPGFRCSDENLLRGAEFLRGLGLVPRVPADLFGDDLLCANSDAVRFEQLRKALFARDSRAVWCVRAGYGAIRFIERLRKLRPPKRRKLFVGYSDATTIHHVLNHGWRWPTLHGPLLDRLGSIAVAAEELEELKNVLFAERQRSTFSGLEPLNAAAARKRTLRGKVFGGNLTVLQTTLGTPLQRNHGEILFLEDIGERGYRVDRMLQHFAQAGAFDRLKAIVLGAFTGGNEADGHNFTPQVWKRFAEQQKFPVFAGMEAGHGEYQRAVWFNAAAELRCGAVGELTINAGGR